MKRRCQRRAQSKSKNQTGARAHYSRQYPEENSAYRDFLYGCAHENSYGFVPTAGVGRRSTRSPEAATSTTSPEYRHWPSDFVAET